MFVLDPRFTGSTAAREGYVLGAVCFTFAFGGSTGGAVLGQGPRQYPAGRGVGQRSKYRYTIACIRRVSWTEPWVTATTFRCTRQVVRRHGPETSRSWPGAARFCSPAHLEPAPSRAVLAVIGKHTNRSHMGFPLGSGRFRACGPWGFAGQPIGATLVGNDS